MIPPLKNNVLPIGIHEATLEEIKSSFATNSKRRTIFEGLLRLIQNLKDIGCNEIYIDGSFVTSKQRPSDIDVCWMVQSNECLEKAKREYPVLFDLEPPRKKQHEKYCADVFPADFPISSGTILDYFQRDKETHKVKGIIKIVIR